MKSYEEINRKIEAGDAVVMTADEVAGYVERKGLEAAAREIDVVTTATFGPMCSSGCFLNFGHSSPRIRMTEAWIQDVPAYAGVAAVDLFIGATQLRHGDPANMNYPGEFAYGGGHVMEDLVAGRELQLFALSYGTDDYPRREVRTYFTINDLNQAIMVNPRNCYQNYNVAVNLSDKTVYSYMGTLLPQARNATYSSAGQLSPLLNDPHYDVIGIGTAIWLAGARGHVYAEGTQHCAIADRNDYGVPSEGAGTMALTADMKQMIPEYVRGVSLRGYGVSLALGVGVPIPVLSPAHLQRACIRDSDIMAPVVDYADDYPENSGRILKHVSYAELKGGGFELNGKEVAAASISSYNKALKIAHRLADEIRRGDFLLAAPLGSLPRESRNRPLKIREAAQ